MSHYKTKYKNTVSLACVSDIHLGNNRTTTDHILKNLTTEFLDKPVLEELDVLCIAGDLYDKLLAHNSQETISIDLFMVRLLKRCKQHNVTVYVLEGTPSHDRGQPRRIKYLNDGIGDAGADVVYFDKLTIHYDARLDLQILFVPDELHHDPLVTFSEVLGLMAAKNLREVDFAFMHGSFKYQLPELVKAPKHDEAAYESIVKHGIFIGHIHRMSNVGKIYAQGSFDRISHNEEEPKGYFKAKLFNREVLDVEFVENTAAKIYHTVNVIGLDLNDSIAKIKDAIRDFPDGSCIRVLMPKTNPLFGQLESLMVQFPAHTWERKEFVVKDTNTPKLADTVLDYVPVYITPENIVDLMSERIKPHSIEHGVEVVTEALRLLNQLVEA